jgi:hypothetical protein
MENNITNNKLDEAIKQMLSNYEVPYNAVDWAQMDSILDVAPAQNPLRKSYSSVILFVFGIILGLTFLLYILFKPSAISEKTNRTPTQQIVKIKTHSNNITPTVASIKNNVKPIVKQVVTNLTGTTSVVPPSKNSIRPTLNNNESKEKLFSKIIEKKEKGLKKEKVFKKAIKQETKREENDTVHIDEENDSNKRQALKITNEANLGAALDTLKGVQEAKKETRKSRREKKRIANDLLNGKNSPAGIINPDEIKKKQEQKDTLTTPN